MATENACVEVSPRAVSPQPAMAAAVVHHQESTTDEAAPIMAVDKDDDHGTCNGKSSPTKALLAKKSKKPHLEQRHRRHFLWSSINVSIALGRVLSMMGIHGAQHGVLRKASRFGGGIKRTTLPGIVHAKATIRGVKVRVYRPADEQPDQKKKLPVLIYLHGGGWVICSARSYHPFTLALCRDTGAIVVSVDYRLAPEHPYPASLDDCLEVTQAILDADAKPEDVGEELAGRVDVNHVLLGGDSAGGNLSAAVGLELIRQGDHRLHALVLVCPVVQAFTQDLDSYRRNNFKYSKIGLSWFLAQYAGIEPRKRVLRLIDEGRHVPDETRQRFSKYITLPSNENVINPTIAAVSAPDSGCQTASSSVPSPTQTDKDEVSKASAAAAEEVTKEEPSVQVTVEDSSKIGGPLVVQATVVEPTNAETHIETENLIEKAEKVVEKTVEIPEAITQLTTTVRAWPLLAEDSELAQMPITMVQVCSDDPLLDEGRIFADRMRMAGAKDVRYMFLPRAQHAEPIFLTMVGSKAAKRGFQEIVDFVKDVTKGSACETQTEVAVAVEAKTEESDTPVEPTETAEPVKTEEQPAEQSTTDAEPVVASS